LLGCNDEFLPGGERAPRGSHTEEEQRRLFYVALTRAAQRLTFYLTVNSKYNRLTRFLAELLPQTQEANLHQYFHFDVTTLPQESFAMANAAAQPTPGLP
jgi:superfamily I DNA/RNA helicase